jgi:hypothetical protein
LAAQIDFVNRVNARGKHVQILIEGNSAGAERTDPFIFETVLELQKIGLQMSGYRKSARFDRTNRGSMGRDAAFPPVGIISANFSHIYEKRRRFNAIASAPPERQRVRPG